LIQPTGSNVPHSKTALAATLLSLLLAGCSSLLPSAKSESSPFDSFDQARLALEGLVPMQSDTGDLRKLGFVPSGLLQRQDLDAGVLACLEAREACRGWEITAARIDKKRTGNFLADFTNFSRRQETTGWRFNGLILLVGEQVVYRSWGGQPRVNEVEITRNPLGPFQDIGPAILTQ
jgi:hypothetical protein